MGEAILNLLKIVLTVILFPFLYVFASRFHQHLMVYPHNPQEFFLFGVLAFLLVFLFVYPFWGVHEVGQKIMGSVFRFAAPIDRFLVNLLPFYPVMVMLVFFVVRNFLKMNEWNHHFLFFSGFTMAMHVLLVAQQMQNEEKGVFRPGYFFAISLVFLCNMLIMILLFDLVYSQFTFFKFFQNNFFDVKMIYQEAYKMIMAGRS